MKDRIIKFIESEKISAAEFADMIGVQRSNVSHVLNGRNNPGFAFIQKILEAFPTINSRWLLTGEGEIYEKKILNAATKIEKPDLFSTIAEKPSTHEKTITAEATPALKSNNVNVSINTEEVVEQFKSKKNIKRVLIFYSDNTFEDFLPAK